MKIEELLVEQGIAEANIEVSEERLQEEVDHFVSRQGLLEAWAEERERAVRLKEAFAEFTQNPASEKRILAGLEKAGLQSEDWELYKETCKKGSGEIEARLRTTEEDILRGARYTVQRDLPFKLLVEKEIARNFEPTEAELRMEYLRRWPSSGLGKNRGRVTVPAYVEVKPELGRILEAEKFAQARLTWMAKAACESEIVILDEKFADLDICGEFKRRVRASIEEPQKTADFSESPRIEMQEPVVVARIGSEPLLLEELDAAQWRTNRREDDATSGGASDAALLLMRKHQVKERLKRCVLERKGRELGLDICRGDIDKEAERLSGAKELLKAFDEGKEDGRAEVVAALQRLHVGGLEPGEVYRSCLADSEITEGEWRQALDLIPTLDALVASTTVDLRSGWENPHNRERIRERLLESRISSTVVSLNISPDEQDVERILREDYPTIEGTDEAEAKRDQIRYVELVGARRHAFDSWIGEELATLQLSLTEKTPEWLKKELDVLGVVAVEDSVRGQD